MSTYLYRDEIETHVNRLGLIRFLDELATICDEKADHLRTNRQDKASAKRYDRAATKLRRLADNLDI